MRLAVSLVVVNSISKKGSDSYKQGDYRRPANQAHACLILHTRARKDKGGFFLSTNQKIKTQVLTNILLTI